MKAAKMIGLGLIFILGHFLPAYGEKVFRVQKGSQVYYRVHARAVLGVFRHTIVGENSRLTGEFRVKGDTVSGKLQIPVKGFVSGNSRRDRDVAGILEVEKHPEIIFEIVEISSEALSTLLDQSEGEIQVQCRLTVAGVSKVYRFPLRFRWIDSQTLRVETEIEARFTDFGIEPPRIRGLGAIGRAITSAPDQVFLGGSIILKRESGP